MDIWTLSLWTLAAPGLAGAIATDTL